MNLCDDCRQAEVDAYGIGVTHAGRLCCTARSLAFAPRKLQREAAEAFTRGLSPADADAVKARAREIIRARRGVEA